MDSDSIISSHPSLRTDRSFGVSAASTPRTSLNSGTLHSGTLHSGADRVLGSKHNGMPAPPSPVAPASLLPAPPASPNAARSTQRRRRRVASDVHDASTPHSRSLHMRDLSPGYGPTAHDISKSAQSALQLLQARSDLQVQQQREARHRANSRAEAHARLSGCAGAGPSTPEPKGKGKSRAHRSRESTETFFSASTSPRSNLACLAAEPQWSSRTSLDSLEPPSALGFPPSIRSGRSNRSVRTSLHSASSNPDLPGSAFDEFSTIPEVPQPSEYLSAPQFATPPGEPRRRRAVSSTSRYRSEPDVDDCYSYLWDVPPHNGPSNSLGTAFPKAAGSGAAPSAWDEHLASSLPRQSRFRSTASAPGSRRPSFSAEERPHRPASTRNSSPARMAPGVVPPKDMGVGLSDLTSLRALDMGHRQLTHASSLARTLTRPLSAPLKPVLQFWLAASFSAFALLSLSSLMACSYLLTMYDDASRRTRSVSSAAAKARAKAKAHPITGPFRAFSSFLFSPIRKLLRIDSKPLPADTSNTVPDDDAGGFDADGKDSLKPPGPRPPLGPLLASLALTLTIAMGTGIFRLFVSYRTKETQPFKEPGDQDASPLEPVSDSSARRAASTNGSRAATTGAPRPTSRWNTVR